MPSGVAASEVIAPLPGEIRPLIWPLPKTQPEQCYGKQRHPEVIAPQRWGRKRGDLRAVAPALRGRGESEPQIACRLEAVGRIFFKTVLHDLAHAGGYGVRQLRRVLPQVGLHRFHQSLAVEGAF